MMHNLILSARLVVSIRQATANPRNVVPHAFAISLAETLWRLTQAKCFAGMLKTSVLTVDGFVAKETMDPLMHDLRFDSSQSMLICTRYSLFQILL
jgi:hypothetical protein